MLNSEESNRRSAANEAVVAEQFKNLNYLVKRLDSKSSKKPRPDFLISNSCGPQMLCEVKTINSGGYLSDKGVHVSTLDENLGKFECPIDLIKIDECLADAVRKRKALVEDDSRFADLPLLVAFFFDLLAEYLPFYPHSFDERDERFREVSGILTIKDDVEMTKAFDKLSDEEKKRRLETGDATGLPPNSKDFALLQNKAALRKVPKDFERQCLPDADYE
jgi:hypothetical protein